MTMWATTKSSGKLKVGQVVRYGGYPADSRFRDMDGLNLWRTRGKLKASADQRLLSATGFVARGMSGSPVWRSFGKDSPCGQPQCAVGILTECSVNSDGECRLGEQATRRAVRITPRVRKTIKNR